MGGFAENFGSGLQSAQLPNIKGEAGAATSQAASVQWLSEAISTKYTSGALDFKSSGVKRYDISNGTGSDTRLDRISFDASKSDPTYTNGGEVRPANYTVKIWQRTA